MIARALLAAVVSAASGRRTLRGALLAVIGFYSRAISPALPPRCRFHPTCSAYAAEAIEVHGTARGIGLALVRLGKCAPWHPGGLDPVPRPDPSGTGTGAECCSSNSLVDPAAPSQAPAPRTARATPPATRRARQEESSVV